MKGRGHERLNFRLERYQRIEARNNLRKVETFAELFPKVEAMALDFYGADPKRVATNVAKLTAHGIPEKRARELISDALGRREYHESEITPQQHLDLLEIASQKERISRAILREVVKGKNKLGLSPSERNLILGGLRVQNAYDQLFLSQRHALLVEESTTEAQLRTSPDLQNEHGKPDPTKVQEHILASQPEEHRESHLFDDAFNFSDVVFANTPDRGIQPQPYAEAFPTETQRVVRALKRLRWRERLNRETLLARALRRDDFALRQAKANETYFSALITAVSSRSTNIPQRNKNWSAVDEAWMATEGRVQFLHMMESYHDHALGRRQEPEFDILIQDRTDAVNRQNQELAALKGRQMEALRTQLPQNDLSFDPVDPIGVLKHAEAQLFAAILPAGTTLAFRFAGDNVPNRPDVKAKRGVKIIENQPTFEERAEKQIDLLQMVFDGQIDQTHFPTQNPKDYRAAITRILETFFVPGHEYAHNILQTKTHIDLLSPKLQDQLEEHKADLGIITVAPDLLDSDGQKQFISALFADTLRALTHNDSHRNGAVMSAYNLIESGILQTDGQIWTFSLTQENMAEFFRLERQQLAYMRDIYLYDHDHPITPTYNSQAQITDARALAKQQVARYTNAELDPRMEQLIKKITRKPVGQ